MSLPRRRFLASSLAAASAPWGSARAEVAPSERLQLGFIGLGARGGYNLKQFLAKAEVQVVALCDVDDEHLKAGLQLARDANQPCQGHRDFRSMIARHKLDAVVISLPDHWHAIPAIACAEAGIDIYSEPPLALTLVEGQAILRAVERFGRVWQTGTTLRSDPYFQRACGLVARQAIGPVHTVEIGSLGGARDYTNLAEKGFYEEAKGLDFELWQGPSPKLPFHPGRLHRNWRWNMLYGAGHLFSTASHYVDIALWALGLDGSGPTKIEGKAEFAATAIWNAPIRYDIHAQFSKELRFQISDSLAPGVRWLGPGGWIYVDHKTLRASDPGLLSSHRDESINRFTQHGKDHAKDFLDAVRQRHPTVAPCSAAHRAASLCQLGLVAILVGRPIAWHPGDERIIEDTVASELLGRAYREPWSLQG